MAYIQVTFTYFSIRLGYETIQKRFFLLLSAHLQVILQFTRGITFEKRPFRSKLLFIPIRHHFKVPNNCTWNYYYVSYLLGIVILKQMKQHLVF